MTQTKSLLCPVDFTEGSHAAVQQAGQLALELGATVELLHVYQLPVLGLPDGPIVATPDYVTKVTSNAQGALNEQAAILEAEGVTVTTKLVEGDPRQTIIERAKQLGAKMIVMGTHGRSGAAHWLLGSVAERVVRTSEVPVLTVRMKG